MPGLRAQLPREVQGPRAQGTVPYRTLPYRTVLSKACTKYKTDAAEQGVEQGASREGAGGLGQQDSLGYNFQQGQQVITPALCSF